MIVADQVSKQFKTKKVISDLSFHIPRGEIVGIIGKNGAGKSTLIKMMTGLLSTSKGVIRTNGVDPVRAGRKLSLTCSVVFGTTSGLIEDATVQEAFYITAKLYRMSKQAYEKQYQILNDLLTLDPLLPKTKEELSYGEARRAELGMSLLWDMELLILDEALVGLDAVRKSKIFEYLKDLNEKKQVTIIMTSHNLEDIKRICSRVLVLDEGRNVYYGPADYLVRRYAYLGKIILKLADGIPDLEDLAIDSYVITNETVLIRYNRNIISAKSILDHVLKQCNVTDIQTAEQGLEEALIHMSDGKEMEEAHGGKADSCRGCT